MHKLCTMRRKTVLIMLLVVGVVCSVFVFVFRKPAQPERAVQSLATDSTLPIEKVEHKIPEVSDQGSPVELQPSEMNDIQYDQLLSNTHTLSAEQLAQRDLQLASEFVRDYRLVFGGNPVGDNSEITAALTGKNARRIVFFAGFRPTLNAQQEWVDPWGTPYFFHQISGEHMEFVSAGPDARFGTDDDQHQ